MLFNKMENRYCLLAWNVNKYTNITHDRMKYYLQLKPDIVFLSETKQEETILRRYFDEFPDYRYIINSNNPSHWHGVAMLIRRDRHFEQISLNLGITSRNDTKDGNPLTGRIICIKLDNTYTVVGTYVPNSGGYKPNQENKFAYRINSWDPALQNALNNLKSQGSVIWLGDINVAPQEIDVTHPKTMCNYPGFTNEERNNFQSFLQMGWTDIWRFQHPSNREYSWIGHRPYVKYYMRLDNIIISNDLVADARTPHCCQSFILPNQAVVSDHVPIGLWLINPI